MEIDKSSKVIVLPRLSPEKDLIEYKVVDLPIATLSSTKPYLITTQEVYELNTIKGDDSKVKLSNGEAVKSIILEPQDHDIPGAVIQSGDVILATKFNIVYLLISIFDRHLSKFRNFKTLEDIKDSLSSIVEEYSWIYDIPDTVYYRSLPVICDQIIEGNDEKFYKYSNEKSMSWVNDKIEAMSKFVREEKGNSILKRINMELNDPTNIESKVDTDVLQSTITRYSIDFICDSYLIPDIKPKLINQFKYDFTKMEKYLLGLSQKRKNLEAVEANMSDVNRITSNTKSNSNSNSRKQAMVKKKATNKVAVGKGALDGFFKRA
ncbi:hypothetical protein KGF56_001072 [Candida oxycetoniae]|uniref:Ribonuclease H2 subunit B n=1 Tax=Candida oxycetoniae TaxID=497107 RepID=A0AAI9T0K3_9ASCO|nr:uncharacterized protein KGF56_001072 [Candida oxycetoniae]KAI3406230.2 hypothetical protein KGF56_001072 [Candida oxycetoniae]